MSKVIVPQNINEYIGHDETVNLFSKWLQSIIDNPYNPKRICFVTGLNGIGKSTLVKLVLKKYNFTIQEICSSSLRLKDNRTTLYQSFCFKNVLSMVNNTKKFKKAIVIDNFENMELSVKDVYRKLKGFIKEKRSSGIPLIFIGEKYFKNNRPLLKNSIYLRLSPINFNTLLHITKKIVLLNKYQIPNKDIREIARKSGGNIHYIIKYFNKINTPNDNTLSLLEENKQKGPLYSLYRILLEDLSIDDILDEIKTENSLMPYALHNTLPEYISWYIKKNNTVSIKKKIALNFKEIWDLYAIFSLTNDFQKKRQLWELTELINTIACWGFKVVLKSNNEHNKHNNQNIKVKKNKKQWWVDFENHSDNTLNIGVYNKKNRSLLNKMVLTKHILDLCVKRPNKHWKMSSIMNKIELSKLKKK